MVQIVISSAGAGGLAEWVLMELQGEIEARYSTGLAGNLLGDLHYTTEEAAFDGGKKKSWRNRNSTPATHPDLLQLENYSGRHGLEASRWYRLDPARCQSHTPAEGMHRQSMLISGLQPPQPALATHCLRDNNPVTWLL